MGIACLSSLFKAVRSRDVSILNHRESLKNLTDDHDALFYDDMSLKDLDEHTILSLLESNDDRTI